MEPYIPDVEKLAKARDVEGLINALQYKVDTEVREAVWVRKAAAEALGKIGDKRAVESLTAALKDSYKIVRESAANALRGMGIEVKIENPDEEVTRRRISGKKPIIVSMIIVIFCIFNISNIEQILTPPAKPVELEAIAEWIPIDIPIYASYNSNLFNGTRYTDCLSNDENYIIAPYGETLSIKTEFPGSSSLLGLWHSDGAKLNCNNGIDVISAEPYGSTTWGDSIYGNNKEFTPCICAVIQIDKSCYKSWVTVTASLKDVSYPRGDDKGITFYDMSKKVNPNTISIFVISPEEYEKVKSMEISRKEYQQEIKAYNRAVTLIIIESIILIIVILILIKLKRLWDSTWLS